MQAQAQVQMQEGVVAPYTGRIERGTEAATAGTEGTAGLDGWVPGQGERERGWTPEWMGWLGPTMLLEKYLWCYGYPSIYGVIRVKCLHV